MKLILETEHEKHTVEFKNIDANMEQLLIAFHSLLIGATFPEETIFNGMQAYLEDYLSTYLEEFDEEIT